MDPNQKRNDKDRDDLYDVPASEPERPYSEETDYQEEPPSQAEGDRETIEADLKDKGLEEDEKWEDDQ